MDSTVRTLQFSKNEKDRSRFLALPASGQNCGHLLSAQNWKALTRWSATLNPTKVHPNHTGFSFPVALLCHLQTGGPVCYIVPYSSNTTEESSRFLLHHKACCDRNEVMILKFPAPKINGSTSTPSEIEYCLAPFWGIDPQQGKIPTFAVYATGLLAIDFLLGRVLQHRRLPVVFDLDETLVKARTLSHLSEESIRATIEPRRAQLMAAANLPSSTEEERNSIRQQLQQLKAEDQMLRQDAFQLHSYRNTDTITIKGGKVVKAEFFKCPFYAELPGGNLDPTLGWIPRPVIQPPQTDLVFTRIRPEDRETSMIFRIRPYWNDVRTFLLGGTDANGKAKKPLIEAFVCTTAVHEYAHEVWRVLDVGEALIPHEKWLKRILSKAGSKKYLAPTLGLFDHPPSSGRVTSIMPFAVIIDDILAIWEPKVQNQVIHISKWEPYTEWGSVVVAGQPWEQAQAGLDMLKIGGILQTLHKEMFDQIDSQLSQYGQMKKKENGGVSWEIINLDLTQVDTSYAGLFSAPPWTARLLPEIKETAQPLPLPARAQAMIRAHTEKLKARKIAKAEKEKEQARVAAAAAAVPAPVDPRIAARAAAAAAAEAKRKQQEQEQQREEPTAFNPETDADIFAGWGAMVTKDRSVSVPEPQQEEEEEAEGSRNKRKRQDANEQLDEEREKSPSLELENPTNSPSDDDVLKERYSADPMDPDGDNGGGGGHYNFENDDDGPSESRKKLQLTPDHPVILLSQAAQEQGKHLVYSVQTVHNGNYFVQIKADGVRLGFAPGNTEDEARKNASEVAYNKIRQDKDSSGGAGNNGVGTSTDIDAPAFGVAPQTEVINFDKALDKIKELFRQTMNGQNVVLNNVAAPGAPLYRYRCRVRRDFDSEEEELIGFGEGTGYYQAKREAAAQVLRQLGYTVTEYVPR